MPMLLTQLDGSPIGISPKHISFITKQSTGTRITFGDGSQKDVTETFENVMHAAASIKKEKGSNA